MNNYTILLEQFHIYQQQQTATHQQFAQIIDYIRNEKQNKQSLIIRKKQQKVKLIHLINRIQQKSISTPKLTIMENTCQNLQELQEINNVILKKENQDLQKQVNKIRKQVKQIQDQLTVYNRKQNQIKQLKYSSKRQLDNTFMKLKNQKLINLQFQQKYDRIIEQLTLQKTNLQHQNRFLADQLSLNKNKYMVKSMTRNCMKNSMVMFDNFYNFDIKIEEIYTKKKIQQKLRCLYVIFIGRNNWNGSKLIKNFNQIQNQAQNNLHIIEHFHFLSKSQIFTYYLSKFNQNSFLSTISIIIQFYNSLTKSIKKLESINNFLTIRQIELQEQQQKYNKILNQIEFDKVRNTIVAINQFQKDNQISKQNVRITCCKIYQILERLFKLIDKIRKILNTLQNVSDRNQNKNYNKLLTVLNPSNLSRRNSSLLKDKRISDIPSSKNIGNSHQINTSSSLINTKINTSNFGDSINKSFLHSKLLFLKPDKIITQFQAILFKNPKQIICVWEDVIRNNQNGVKFLYGIISNDLYRIFVDPNDYCANQQQMTNFQYCINKAYESTQKLVKSLKQNFLQILNYIFKSCKQIQNNNKYTTKQNICLVQQPKYVIESKGYYRFDNFKLLQKLQLLQTKKKGLYIPYRYGVDMEQQIIYDKKQTKKDSLEKVKINLLGRQPRNTAPETQNYISCYRSRVNKADKKIRDLLSNIDSLKIVNKFTSRNLSTRQSGRLTERSMIQG